MFCKLIEHLTPGTISSSYYGRSSDLSIPEPSRLSDSGVEFRMFCGLTAAGTVPVFHRIPFSIAQPGRDCNHHNRCKGMEKQLICKLL